MSRTLVVLLLVPFFTFSPRPTAAGCGEVAPFLEHGAFGVADPQGNIITACNPDLPLIPASILKLATSLAALRILGPDFRFHTDFSLDDSANLYIRGRGDPFLVSEEARRIAFRLRDLGLSRVAALYIDNSIYNLETGAPGRGNSANPYDAPVTATAVNFNTVKIRVKENGRVVSAEPQTPDLPIMAELGAGLDPGVYRLNICRSGCGPDERAGRYAAELFRALLMEEGVVVGKEYGLRRTPAGARLLYSHANSRSLEEVIGSFLTFSNNFVANQVFLACGMTGYGEPATWTRARRSVDDALPALTRPGMIQTMDDGAGLSRRNRVTVEAMLQVLADFRPYRHLLPAHAGVVLKSGTLQGVYNYAGYLAGGRPFVIMLNQPRNTRDRILARLNRQYGLSRTDIK